MWYNFKCWSAVFYFHRQAWKKLIGIAYFETTHIRVIISLRLRVMFARGKKTKRKKRRPRVVENWSAWNEVACALRHFLGVIYPRWRWKKIKKIFTTYFTHLLYTNTIFFSPRTHTWNRFWRRRRTRRPRCVSRYCCRTEWAPRSTWGACRPYPGSWTRKLTITPTPTTDHRRS